MSSSKITCIYCGAANPAGTNRCVACGAPIEIPVTPPVRVTTVNRPTPTTANRPETTPEQIRDALDAAPISEQLKDGLKVAGASLGSLGVGAFIARTAAEAGGISISAFLIGFYAAMTRNFLLGLFGGMFIGLMVGLVVKRPLGALVSAPFGTIAGLIAARFVQNMLPEWPLYPLLGLLGGTIFALLGGRRGSSNVVTKWYQRLRPLLGMVGGFIFALLGYAIGGLAR